MIERWTWWRRAALMAVVPLALGGCATEVDDEDGTTVVDEDETVTRTEEEPVVQREEETVTRTETEEVPVPMTPGG